LYNDRDFSDVLIPSAAAMTAFGDKPDNPAHSAKPKKLLRLMPAFGDWKGIWIMDIVKLPGGIILFTGYILMRPC
jgi:hypothetical protein